MAQLQQQLPGIYADALTAVNDAAITDAMQHYATFTAYAHSSAAKEASSATAAMLLPHLENIRKLNTVRATASDTDTSAQPDQGISDRLEQQPGAADVQARATKDSVDIDWDILAAPEADAALATDTAPATGAEATGEVDWDIEIEADAPVTEATQPDADVQGTDINWDIDMTEHADGMSTAESSPVGIEGTGASLQTQQWPESAVRMSNDSACRTSVLDDLHELDSYLHQRAQELSSGSHAQLGAAAPSPLVTPTTAADQKHCVRAC